MIFWHCGAILRDGGRDRNPPNRMIICRPSESGKVRMMETILFSRIPLLPLYDQLLFLTWNAKCHDCFFKARSHSTSCHHSYPWKSKTLLPCRFSIQFSLLAMTKTPKLCLLRTEKAMVLVDYWSFSSMCLRHVR